MDEWKNGYGQARRATYSVLLDYWIAVVVVRVREQFNMVQDKRSDR